MMRVFTVSLAIMLAGCSAATVPVSVNEPAGVHAERGSLTSTLVIPATVQAGGRVTVTAPAAGTYSVSDILKLLPEGLVFEQALVKPGRHVPQNFPIALARVSGFALVAPLSDTATIRLYSVPSQATGQIKDGPGPFACPLADRVPQQGSEALALTCLIPPDLTVFAGMPALMAVKTASVENVIVLPVEAVAGSSQHGQVWLVDAQGKRHRRDVRLGITDGIQIEIRAGVNEGDIVLVPAPNLDQQ